MAANTNVVSITSMDLTIVTPGMTISFGARDRKTGDEWIIGAVAPTGSSGGSVTLAGTYPNALANAAFIIDTTGYLGTDASYAANTNVALLSTLLTLFGPATNLYSGARQIILDKLASTALGRIGFAIAGRTWGDLVHRALTYTPSGGAAATVETLALRAFPDGTNPTDALLIDLSTGTGDLRQGSATMASAATVDLASAPMGKVAITGSATISSFGAGRHYVRLVHFADDGATLKHNAASLILPGGADIIARRGDTLVATSDGSGNWRVRNYQRADAPPVGRADAAVSGRNRIINGAFRVNQRGYVSGAGLAQGALGHDRWRAGASGAAYSFTQGIAETVINITSGSLQQVIEGAHIEGGTYVLSWAGTATARLNTAGAAPSGVYAASPVVVTGVAPGAIVTVEFTAGTLGQVQFEAGRYSTPFERLLLGTEFRECQRYFRRIYKPVMQGIATSATLVNRLRLGLDLPMRATPSIIFSNVFAYDGANGAVISGVAASYSTKETIDVDVNAGSMTAGRAVITIANPDGYLDLSAEV
ncbi:hypothetical protein [Methylorubrum thiocyanatum]